MVEKSLGLSVLPLTPQIARQLGASDDPVGVVVNAVDPRSDAAQKGLQRGDIILKARFKPVAGVADLENAVREAKNADLKALLLDVKRRGQDVISVPIRLR